MVTAPNYLRDGSKFFLTHGFLKLFKTHFVEGEQTHCRKQVLTKMPKVFLQHSAKLKKKMIWFIMPNVVSVIKSASVGYNS